MRRGGSFAGGFARARNLNCVCTISDLFSWELLCSLDPCSYTGCVNGFATKFITG
jgi:hypothetical protein